jgi:hypothetical protein
MVLDLLYEVALIYSGIYPLSCRENADPPKKKKSKFGVALLTDPVISLII